MDILKSERQLYIEQLEDENLRLKNSNKSLRNNNKGLLQGHNKLQNRLYKYEKEIEILKSKIKQLEDSCKETECSDDQKFININKPKFKEEINTEKLIDTFMDMKNRKCLLTHSTQEDLFIQILGTIMKVAMED